MYLFYLGQGYVGLDFVYQNTRSTYNAKTLMLAITLSIKKSFHEFHIGRGCFVFA
jgi:hypothetical protein